MVGPTATGKSALAVELALHLGGEIINADALQVYRGLDIGTAKPSLEERKGVRHHLIDILDPNQSFSAGAFVRAARAAIERVRSRGSTPIVVGGSGLYLRALFRGLSPLPPANGPVREALRAELSREGTESLHKRLAEVDPATAERLEEGDTQRVLRALEVWESSGRTLSEWIGERPFDTEILPSLQLGLTLPRTVLYHRISERVREMIARGWLEELETLFESGYEPSAPAFQAIGYRQLAECLAGNRTVEWAVAEIIQATRRYAKRQQTWFKREPGIAWFDAEDPKATTASVVRFLSVPDQEGRNDKADH